MARAGAELLMDAELLVPVPLHRARLTARRFNQANALAQAISVQCGVPADPFVLARVKPTPRQVGLSRAQRAVNLQGAFRIAEGMAQRIEGRKIVLIDDVMTSGATANAAARALLRGGARPGRRFGVRAGAVGDASRGLTLVSSMHRTTHPWPSPWSPDPNSKTAPWR
jgi:ComF family protein